MLEQFLKGKKGDSNNLADFLDAILGRGDTKVKITIDVGKSRNERDVNGDMYSEDLSSSLSPREQEILAELGIGGNPQASGLGPSLAPDMGLAGRNPMFGDILSQRMGGPNPMQGLDINTLMALLAMLSSQGGGMGQGPMLPQPPEMGGGGLEAMMGGMPPMPPAGGESPMGGGISPDMLLALMGGGGGAGPMPPIPAGTPASPAIPGSTPGGVQPAMLDQLLKSLMGGM